MAAKNKLPIKHKLREEWLHAAGELMRARIADAATSIPKVKLPDTVRVSCGFPSRRALTLRGRWIGESWHGDAAEDKIGQIYISPMIRKEMEVLETLEHEFCHQACPKGAGHKKEFPKLMKALGHKGPWRSSQPDAPFIKWVEEAALPSLGAYPHELLKPMIAIKSKKCPLVVCHCGNPKCASQDEKIGVGYKARITRPALRKFGAPDCPSCGKQLVDPEELFGDDGDDDAGEE